MDTKEVALKLVEHCKKGEFMKAIDTFYGKDIVSIEPMAMPTMPAEMHGFEAVKGKSVWWVENHEVHSSKVEGPFVAGDRFVVYFDFDVTEKKSKKRHKMAEVGIYTVAKGKIVREEFLYLATK